MKDFHASKDLLLKVTNEYIENSKRSWFKSQSFWGEIYMSLVIGIKHQLEDVNSNNTDDLLIIVHHYIKSEAQEYIKCLLKAIMRIYEINYDQLESVKQGIMFELLNKKNYHETPLSPSTTELEREAMIKIFDHKLFGKSQRSLSYANNVRSDTRTDDTHASRR